MNMPAHLRAPDFLHRHAETPLCEQYIAAGALCRLETNSERVLEAANATFLRSEDHSVEAPDCFSIRVWVDEADRAQGPWPKPYVRGLDYLVFAGFDSKSSFLVDLSSRRIFGRVSPAMAQDGRYWRMTIFPMLMTIVSGALGLLELHASCVATGDVGVLLLGAGRSGKSTLAMAMSRVGYRVLSDDRAFCSIQDGRLLAHGLPRPLKLRCDAGLWFDEFRGREPRDRQNDEDVFYCDLNACSPEPCRPKAIVCLDRSGEGCRISRMRRSEVRSRIEADLLAENPEVLERQAQVIDRLTQLPCWVVQYGARPEVIAEQVARLFPETNDRSRG